MLPFDEDLIDDFLSRLYFPRFRAALLSSESFGGFEVERGNIAMVVMRRGYARFSANSPDGGPVQLHEGDVLIEATGGGGRLHGVRGSDGVVQCGQESDTDIDADTDAESQDKMLPPVDDLISHRQSRGDDGTGPLMLYAQFDVAGLLGNPLDVGLPAIIHESLLRHERLRSCLPLLDFACQLSRQPMPGNELTLQRLAELLLVRTLVAGLMSPVRPSDQCGSDNPRCADNRPHSESSLGSRDSDPQREPAGRHRTRVSAIRRLLKQIDADPGRPWTIPGMAKVAGLSRSTFCEAFRTMVGLPPLQYLTKVRMQVAAKLLLDSDHGVTAIATYVGYESTSSFSNTFKRWCGFSPAHYRRRQPQGLAVIDSPAVDRVPTISNDCETTLR